MVPCVVSVVKSGAISFNRIDKVFVLVLKELFASQTYYDGKGISSNKRYRSL